MDQFQNSSSGQGMLKNYYDSDESETPLQVALKKKLKKMYEKAFPKPPSEDDDQGSP